MEMPCSPGIVLHLSRVALPKPFRYALLVLDPLSAWGLLQGPLYSGSGSVA
ncbi:hypothetical protein CBOM_01047 [Ceraceosorus bombacis]|uniref:Uncharacterized protein n=1 Tax=Ceraceosorus bombacis TaxID=401625 RepID=A0A0P1BCZ9_9BASI|nr:hypothetical protein CBOM_01047 [Ceraceosorus bombacis]